MNDRQRQTEFLRQCLLYEDSSECHTLVQRVRELQQNERCVHRAVCLMVVLAALAFVSLGYLAVFLEDFPDNIPRFMSGFFAKASCVLALSSSICLLAFAVLKFVYRQELDHQREECRRAAAKLLELRLGKPRTVATAPVAEEPECKSPERSVQGIRSDKRAFESPRRVRDFPDRQSRRKV